MIKLFVFVLMLTMAGNGNLRFEPPSKGCDVFGRIKIVEAGEDYRVRIVSAGEDVRVKYVEYNANTSGLWRKVMSGEDYRIRIVSSGEDFRIREVNSGYGCKG